MTANKERPILFNGEMVRAILNGTKTQTRRVVKDTGLYAIDPIIHGEAVAARELERLATRCPFGQPGDRLWVRESHWWFKDEHNPVTGYFPPKLTLDDVVFRADGDDKAKTWRPSIHMPRWASRITLEIVAVRVERLQSTSEADAKAEGVGCDSDGWFDYLMPSTQCCQSAKDSFATLWKSINGEESWDENPWVWVVEFKRVEGGEK